MRDEDFGKFGVPWTVRMKDGSFVVCRGGDCGVAGAVYRAGGAVFSAAVLSSIESLSSSS